MSGTLKKNDDAGHSVLLLVCATLSARVVKCRSMYRTDEEGALAAVLDLKDKSPAPHSDQLLRSSPAANSYYWQQTTSLSSNTFAGVAFSSRG